jgi:uncharacterized protein
MMSIVRKGFIAEGTTCEACEKIIERQARSVPGVKAVTFDYSKEQGYVTYDSGQTDIDAILFRIEEKGYKCYIMEDKVKEWEFPASRLLGWVFGIIGVLVLGYFLFSFADMIALPEITPSMGYLLLFAVGLLTGFHCVAMCGGFVLSYTTKDAEHGRSSYGSHLLYASGKLLSYTIIGAAFGLLGSIVAFTPLMRGIAGILAGIFLLLFGLRMLNVIPSLRKMGIRSPAFVSRFVAKNSRRGPLVIGLLNGLMIACGPLQAIYVMAAGTGSITQGAMLLFVFGLGTLPVMLGFGYLTSLISKKWTSTIVRASGALIIILGLLMVNNGLALTGTGYDLKSLTTTGNAAQTPQPVSQNGYQEIHMDVTADGWSPDTFVLKRGVPVKWIINGKEITSCNRAIQVPKLGLKFDVKSGEQTIEFTPTEDGTIPWSCWMGMIPGTFIVTDNVDDKQALITDQPAKQGGTCGGGSTCGCGMM